MKFIDPPTDARASSNWPAVAAELRANPGQWALVREGCPATQAYSIKKGQIRAFKPAGSFEAVARTVENGSDIYARFVGEVSA